MREAEAMSHFVGDEAEFAQRRVTLSNNHAVACKTVIDSVVVDGQHLFEWSQVDAVRMRCINTPLNQLPAISGKVQVIQLG